MLFLRIISIILSFHTAYTLGHHDTKYQQHIVDESDEQPSPLQNLGTWFRQAASEINNKLSGFHSSNDMNSIGEMPKPIQERASEAAKDVKADIQNMDFSTLPVEAKKLFKNKKEDYIKMDYEDMPERIKDWIKKNPKQMAFLVVNMVAFFAPGMMSAPLLWLLGFTGAGTTGLAARIMSKIGMVTARSIFATLQSAGMGGYGVAIVNGVMQGVSGVASLVGLGKVIKYENGEKKNKTYKKGKAKL